MTRPLRSMLFAPGNQPRKVAKVASFGADAIILDLEDAVPPAEKQATRPRVREALATLPNSPPRYVRVNALETGLTPADLEAVVCPELDGVKLPKVETAAEVFDVDRMLADLERQSGLAAGTIDLIPAIETARGVLNVGSIAGASSRVRHLSFGAGDYCRDVGVRFSGTMWEPDGIELLYARSQIVLACRVAGLEPPIDTVWLDIGDNEGLERDARAAYRLGFQGKSAIHPAQVPIINAVFSPTAEEIEYAQRVVEAFERAEASGTAAIAVDGRMVDYPIVAKARWLLERARGFGLLSGSP